MRSRLRLMLTAVALATATCGPESPVTGPIITALPRDLTAAEQSLIQADNRLAIKLLRQAAADTRDSLANLFLSPLSVAMALAMTYNGAAGTTEAAMRATLELEGMTIAEVNEAYRSLIDLLRGLDPRVRFQIANSIWYRHDFTVEPAFLDVNRTAYDARVEALDFRSPAASRTINDWVKNETNGLIPEIVETPLPDWALMYLINAIYFKGDWTQQFDKRRTAPRPFHLVDGSITNVAMMTHGAEADVRQVWDPAVQVLELPYGGRAYTMTIVMPRDPAGIDALVRDLTAAQWDGWVAALDSSESEVFLPKFRLTNDLLLNSTLTALGMAPAFDCDPPETADFTRMTPQQVCITRVKHKTYVDVNEEGTEAAAVTAVEMGPTSAPLPIVVDRPFLFAVRENLSGTIVFMGVIRNPATP
ncbi:MAG: serpin family protein [Gemmatimonadales bacterium]